VRTTDNRHDASAIPLDVGSMASGCRCRTAFDAPGVGNVLADAIRRCLGPHPGRTGGILHVVCVGTDRSTGDALGPLVGSKLRGLIGQERTVRLLGTLDEPVHAGNLTQAVASINVTNPQRDPVLAVDACLGKAGSVGQITVNMGPLRPGAGVAKDLPLIGNVHIAGVVNVGGFMEYLVLQNTRLSTVMRMADAIARGIYIYVSNP
jgi:putative sporulation protein YyaC